MKVTSVKLDIFAIVFLALLVGLVIRGDISALLALLFVLSKFEFNVTI